MATRGEKQTEARSGRDAASGTTDKRSGQSSSADAERSITTSDESARRERTEATARDREGARGTSVTRRPNVFRGSFPTTPWELMRRMSEELDQLVETLGATRTGMEPRSFSGPAASTAARGLADVDVTGTAPWVPQIDVIRRSHELVVRADLPGIKPDELEVSVDDGLLTIRGERQEEVQREEREGLVRSERRYGAFYRAIPLPEGADENGIAATFRNGVLEITVPLSAEERGRRIAVQS